MKVIEIIFALFVPPVAVLLDRGPKAQFWICVLLTLLAWLPGVVYAFWVLTQDG
jgi:uncharacterized membrane protein YqaE (UPF0057 family)